MALNYWIACDIERTVKEAVFIKTILLVVQLQLWNGQLAHEQSAMK